MSDVDIIRELQDYGINVQVTDPGADPAEAVQLTAEAVQQLERSLSARCFQEYAHFNLGSALATLGQLDGALARYREALRLRPEDLAHRPVSTQRARSC